MGADESVVSSCAPRRGSATNHRQEADGDHRADAARGSNPAPRSEFRLEPVAAAKRDPSADEAKQLDEDRCHDGRPPPVPRAGLLFGGSGGCWCEYRRLRQRGRIRVGLAVYSRSGKLRHIVFSRSTFSARILANPQGF